MPNLLNALKSEIARLAAKEAKREVGPVRKINAAQRGLIAGLRRQVEALRKELAGLKRAVPKPERVDAAPAAPEGRFWITGKGVKTLRRRLGLTQVLFAKLAGVSLPTIVNWEGTDGKVDIRRKATVAQLQAIRGMGKKQVAEILGLGEGKPAKTKRQAKAAPTGKAKAKAKVKAPRSKPAPKARKRKASKA